MNTECVEPATKTESADTLFNGEPFVLVLAIKEQKVNPVLFSVVPQNRWKKVKLTTGGNSKNHKILECVSLKINKAFKFRIAELVKAYKGCNLSTNNILLNDIIEYRSNLQEILNLDCNESFNDIEEGVYPIDCSAETLHLLCDEYFPEWFFRDYTFKLYVLVR